MEEKLIITLGSDGCSHQGIKYPVPQVEIKDCSGAGDTFISGLIFYLNKARMLDINSFENITKKNWLNCLNFASKVAELNCLKAGCEPPHLNDVKKIIKIDSCIINFF